MLRYLLLQLARIREHERVAARLFFEADSQNEEEDEQDKKSEFKKTRSTSIKMGELGRARNRAATGES